MFNIKEKFEFLEDGIDFLFYNNIQNCPQRNGQF